MRTLLRPASALLLLDCAAGMSEAMMQEAARKIDFWDHLDYAAIVSQRGSVASAATCSGGAASGYACSNVDLKSFLPLESIGCGAWNNEQVTAGYANDIWGWTSPGGLEIAIVGCSTGTSFVDITDPVNPNYVGFMARTTSASYWSDIKVYGDYAYVASESSGSGLQILSLAGVAADAASGLTGQSYSPTTTYTGVSTTHNLEVNVESGYMYVLGAYGGSDSCSGGLHVLDVLDPANPAFVTCYTGAGYVHDAHCVMYHGPDAAYQGREVCITFAEDKVVILDVTLKCDIQVISTNTYPETSYTHQGWFSEDHSYFSMGDEMDEQSRGVNTRTLFWDATSLSSPVLMKDYRAATTVIDHNQYNVNKYIFQSNYCGGLHILNGSIPVPMTASDAVEEVGFFEVSTSCSGAGAPWLGSWSNYPFFHSGNVAVASIENGLFVLRPQFYDSGPVSVAEPVATITRSNCVPTTAPTPAATTAATTATTVASTPSAECVSFTITMTDSWGDGWNNNYLYFDDPANMATTAWKVTLSGGFGGSATMCLPPGSYSPFCCGGSWANEVSWSIDGYGISGGAHSSCTPTSGSFTLLSDGQTVAPSPSPTPVPTVLPTAAPTSCPSEGTVVVHMTDTYGDGWNGNYLYFDDASAMATTTLKMTFTNGYSKTDSICLPPGTYSPFACGGGWAYECGWSIDGRGISGGADNSCTPSSGSFTVADSSAGCCCDAKLDQALTNQGALLTEIDPTATAAESSRAGSSSDSGSGESAAVVTVDAVTLIVGTVVFAGVFTGMAAVAFFNRQRYMYLDDALSGGGSTHR